MDCVYAKRSCGRPSLAPLDSPSPVILSKVEKLIDERFKEIEIDLIARTQNVCMSALMPELMSRIDKTCRDIVKAEEPGISARVREAVSSDICAGRQNMCRESSFPSEPTPEPKPHVDILMQEVSASGRFQEIVNSAVERVTSEALQKLNSVVRDVHGKIEEQGKELQQFREDSKAHVCNDNDLIALNRFLPVRTPCTFADLAHEVHTPVAPSSRAEEGDIVVDHPPVRVKQSHLVAVPLQSADSPLVLPCPFEDQSANEEEYACKQVVQVDEGEQHEELELRACDSKARLTRNDTAEKQSHFQVARVRHADAYKIQDTVWEMIIVARTGWTTVSGDIQLVVAFFVNVLMQMVLAIIIWKTFSVTEDMDVDVPSLEKWRVTNAHNYLHVDPISQETLVSRVCRYDGTLGTYTNYVSILSDIDVYNEPLWPLNVGQMLCCLVVLIWVLTVVDDALDCFGFLHGVASVPRGWCSRLESTSEDEYGALELKFAEITNQRLAFAIVACLTRLVVATIFLFIGCKWLAHTYDFADLLLNSVALAFVFRLDELCFEVLVPIDVYTVCEVLQPLPLKAHLIKSCRILGNWNGSDMSRIPLIVFALCFFVYICIDHIQPRTEQLRAAQEALCGGKLNFAIGYDARTGLLYTSPTTSGSSNEVWPDGIPGEIPIIRALTDDSNYLSVPGVAHMESISELSQSVEMYIHTYVNEVYDSCNDRIQDAPPYVLPTLQRHNSNPSATTCEGLKADCFHLDQLYLRMNCPVSCGATSPRSGLFLNEARRGIPKELCQARKEYQDELSAIPCSDLSKTDLDALPGWKDAWGLMREFWDKRSTENRQACWKIVSDMFLLEGCNAVSNLTSLECMAEDYKQFCNAGRDFLNVAYFCPVACGCVAGTNEQSACPPSCTR